MAILVKFRNGYTIQPDKREYLRIYTENESVCFYVNSEQQYWEAVNVIVSQYGYVPQYEVVKLK
jgi:hypothetical protein